MEVYDAELYGIREAATHALRYCQTTSKRCDVWTFTDNQAAIMRVANLKPGPGQETAVAVAKASNALKALNSTITVQWVPGHANVLETKLRTAWQRKPPTTTSLAYLKRMACENMKKEWRQWWVSKEENTMNTSA